MLVLSNILFAQQQANNWYFGYKNGLTFNKSNSCPNPPCTIYDGQITAEEGFSSYSDCNGELLFYAEGERIWNKNHEIMENGDSIFGHWSATQSTIIIPYPGKTDYFYLFSVDGVAFTYCGEKGFNYSIIDISENGGLGKVIVKNNNLLNRCTEKLAAFKNNNCNSYWVIIHEWNSNAFRSYLITETGISEPVISYVGSIHKDKSNFICNQCENKPGFMKISPIGDKIAVAVLCDAFVEIFDFDYKTGVISNNLLLKENFFKRIYGIEFSPNGKFLYLYNGYHSVIKDFDSVGLYQYDISINKKEDIPKSKYKLNDVLHYGAGLQLGPDGKLYIAYWDDNRIDVIENPNKKYPDCNYRINILTYKDNSGGSFPNFISSYFAENGVTLPDTTAKVGNEISIPINILMNCACDANDSVYTYKTEIEFDGTFFYPYNSPNITDSKVVNGQRILTLEGEFTPESQKTLLAEIPGLVLLGNGNKTPLKINKFEILNSDINIETQDGSLEIYGVCQPELSQIKLFDPLQVELTPNPTEDKIKLSLRSAITNDVKISLSNYMGNTVKEFNLNVDVLQKSNEAELDVSDLPSGLYFATIRSGGQVQTEKFVVIR